MQLHAGGIPVGRIVNITSITSFTHMQLDEIRRMLQTTRRESVAWFCLEEPIGVDEAIKKYMENK